MQDIGGSQHAHTNGKLTASISRANEANSLCQNVLLKNCNTLSWFILDCYTLESI